jgi:RNA polymerase sigma-70 factor (ECF subfamily)
MLKWLRPAAAHFDRVVRAYSPELFRYAAWLCRDRHRAEDILQEAFARAWKSWSQVESEAARRSWLYTIVRNEFLRDAGRVKARMEASHDGQDAQDDGPIDIADDIDFAKAVEITDLLAKLPEKYLEPLFLQSAMGMSCDEIAAIMNLTVGATMTRMTRARMALRDLMQDESSSNVANVTNATAAKPALRLVQSGGKK